jgi:heme/copper-type cytochrome/quinol oxidase subunit 2
MSARSLSTRRGFVLGASFGIVGLYVAWAALDLAPWPFEWEHHPADGHGPEPAAPTGDHGGHGAAPAGLSPEEFRRLADEFVRRHRLPDGSVGPAPSTPVAEPGAAVDPHALHGPSAVEPGGPPGPPGGPAEVYLMAFQWGFEPAVLRLEVGRPYRFRMMAVDVPHGLALQLGSGSHVVRLRPGFLVERDLTFLRAGSYLVYCTVFCGTAHERMAGRILVV